MSQSGASEIDLETLSKGLKKVLDRNGYGFQAAITEEIGRLFNSGVSKWIFESAELPVALNQYETKIDLILRHKDNGRYIVAETKRVNPSLSNWCFAKGSQYKRNQTEYDNYIDGIECLTHSNGPIHRTFKLSITPTYDLSFEMKNPTKQGEANNTGRGAIDEALKQVFIANGGYLNFLRGNFSIVPKPSTPAIIPTIFTTARLFVSDVDLRKSDLQNGQVPDNNLTEVDYLYYRYPISPSFVPDMARLSGDSIAKIFDNIYMRTVAIVNHSGLTKFLKSDWDLELTN